MQVSLRDEGSRGPLSKETVEDSKSYEPLF